VLSCTKFDSVSTLIDGKKIIPSCCILPPRACKPGILDGKNANSYLSHQNKKNTTETKKIDTNETEILNEGMGKHSGNQWL
jgi:hypothetical protein